MYECERDCKHEMSLSASIVLSCSNCNGRIVDKPLVHLYLFTGIDNLHLQLMDQFLRVASIHWMLMVLRYGTEYSFDADVVTYCTNMYMHVNTV